MTPKVFRISITNAYPLLGDKVEKNGRTKAQLDEIIAWLTGYDAHGLAAALDDGRDVESFFAQASAKNPNRTLIKGESAGFE